MSPHGSQGKGSWPKVRIVFNRYKKVRQWRSDCRFGSSRCPRSIKQYVTTFEDMSSRPLERSPSCNTSTQFLSWQLPRYTYKGTCERSIGLKTVEHWAFWSTNGRDRQPSGAGIGCTVTAAHLAFLSPHTRDSRSTSRGMSSNVGVERESKPSEQGGKSWKHLATFARNISRSTKRQVGGIVHLH